MNPSVGVSTPRIKVNVSSNVVGQNTERRNIARWKAQDKEKQTRRPSKVDRGSAMPNGTDAGPRRTTAKRDPATPSLGHSLMHAPRLRLHQSRKATKEIIEQPINGTHPLEEERRTALRTTEEVAARNIVTTGIFLFWGVGRRVDQARTACLRLLIFSSLV